MSQAGVALLVALPDARQAFLEAEFAVIKVDLLISFALNYYLILLLISLGISSV